MQCKKKVILPKGNIELNFQTVETASEGLL